MIKIAFVIDTIESPTAGTEKQLLLLLQHIDRTRFEPLLCVLRSSPWLRENFRLCPLYEIGITSFGSIKSVLSFQRFVRFLKLERIDILQTHFRDGSIVGITAAKIAGTKVILGTRRNQGYWLNRRERVAQKLLNVWTTAFIANSSSTRDYVCRVEQVSESRVSVIHNGVDLERFANLTEIDRVKAREDLGIPAEARVVGIVANLRPVKQLEVFLRAAKRVNEKSPDVRFVIVGEGSERQHLDSVVRNLGIEKRVVFLGRRTDIPYVLSSFDIGVLSSSSESFSNALVEYLAAGLPIVTTDVGGANDIVMEGVNGYIVPVGDYAALAEKIIAVLSRGAGDMGAVGRSIAEKRFAIATMVSNTENLYLNLSEHLDEGNH